MFVLTMYVMLLTLDDYKPTYQDRLATPGMMIRPKGNALEISYNSEDTESWDLYVQALDNFLAPYNESQQIMNNKDCTPNTYFIQEDAGEIRNNPKRSCQFNRTVLGNCSGINDRYYGYPDGQPCVLIKLNRVIGMLPGKDDQSPYVTCGAKVNYSQPLVAVKFLNVTYNADINVECKINSLAIANPTSDRDKFAGRVSFKLRINKN
ncbi:hypothetical protein JZ751_006712 [Albula glossodonta]|uniref:Sodium/potassium-transporting ATPase subunit beta-2 n=1 Tax=Albula glossodonta TaxID=121402 RepID=A0A8T2P543_9TELE|nr:hypothetical protein JZ751_006712 [Albula glossodonta]